MKNILKIQILLILSLSPSLINCYSYTFFNHTTKPIVIAIQFRGSKGEPLYKKLIKADSKETLEEGTNEIPLIKAKYCLHHIYYVKEPTNNQKKNKYERAPWKEIFITWLDSDKYDDLIKSADIVAIKKNPPSEKNKHQSLCTDRHFDIIEDKNNKLFLISAVL